MISASATQRQSELSVERSTLHAMSWAKLVFAYKCICSLRGEPRGEGNAHLQQGLAGGHDEFLLHQAVLRSALHYHLRSMRWLLPPQCSEGTAAVTT